MINRENELSELNVNFVRKILKLPNQKTRSRSFGVQLLYNRYDSRVQQSRLCCGCYPRVEAQVWHPTLPIDIDSRLFNHWHGVAASNLGFRCGRRSSFVSTPRHGRVSTFSSLPASPFLFLIHFFSLLFAILFHLLDFVRRDHLSSCRSRVGTRALMHSHLARTRRKEG